MGMCATMAGKAACAFLLTVPAICCTSAGQGRTAVIFREAVLPLNPELQASLTTEGISPELRACAVCGKAFLPEGRQAYCSDACKAEGNRRKSRDRMRKMREKRPGGCYDLPPQRLDIPGFLRVFQGWEYLITFLPGLPSYFVTSSTSGHVNPRHRKKVSLGDSTRICDFESCHL